MSTNSGNASYASADGTFNHPQGVAYDAKRNEIWVADTANNRVQELTTTPSTTNVSSSATSSAVRTYTGFSSPGGIAVDPDGTVYVADTKNNQIKKFDGTTWSVINGATGFFSGPLGALHAPQLRRATQPPPADRLNAHPILLTPRLPSPPT